MHSMVVTEDPRSRMFPGMTSPWDFSRSGLTSHTGYDAQAIDATMRQDQSKAAEAKQKKLRFDMGTVGSDGDAGSVLNPHEDEESRKRRELLARRPSYRKIFNELHDSSNAMAVPKIEDDGDSNDSLMSNEDLSSSDMMSHGGGAGLQTLTMTNAANNAAQVASNSGATIVQYAQGSDGQFFIPVSTISAGNISYQIAPGNNQGVVMATGGPVGTGEEASRKRELRLLKNREAARECRRKKKEYIKCLENRVALLENQNKTLIEELKSLKELYCQKETS